MHANTFNLMARFVAKYLRGQAALAVLDVGSLNINGTYRDLFPQTRYVGVDVVRGPGVDVVTQDPYHYPFDAGSFDVVISGQALEHSYHPWRMVDDMARVLKPGGLICCIAPWKWEIHRHPVDCFRILPDGMRGLLSDAGLTVLESFHEENDTCGIGRKPC